MIDVLLFSDSAQRSQALAQQLEQCHIAHRLRALECGAGQLERHLPQTVSEQLLIVAFAGLTATDIAALEQLSRRSPQTSCLLIVEAPSAELLMNAMRAGLRHVLTWPPQGDTLRKELASIAATPHTPHTPPPPQEGRILSFVSAKGGSGTSLVAANFADACAAIGGQHTLLLDLNRQYADACLYLQDQPAATLEDLITQMVRFDAALFDSCITQISPNLHVLAGMGDPIKAMQLQPEHLQQILDHALKTYSAIVIDIGTHIDPVVMAALDHSHSILCVTQQSLPQLAAGKRLQDILRELGYTPTQIKLLVNRYDKNAEITLKTVLDTLGIDSAHTLVNDAKRVAQAANQGCALRNIAPACPFSQQIAALATQHFPPAAPGAGKGLFRRLSLNPFKPKNTR